jgi:hypothetical protein
MQRNPTLWTLAALLAAALLAAAPPSARAAEDADAPTDGAPEEETRWMAAPGGPEASAAEHDGWEKPIPVTFSIDYTLVSDYIWRGQNFSEDPREGRERPNHQMTVGVEVDTGDFGAVGYSAWFEWWAGEKQFNGSSGYLQEVDHTVYWTYDLSKLSEDLPLTVTVGWIAYVFPQADRRSDGYYTNELFWGVELDDSVLFGTDKAVLSPSFTWYADLDDMNGSWWEFGISHTFEAADAGLDETPVLKDLSLTPSWTMGVDHNFYDADGKCTRLATLVYGLELGYDLSSALELPEQYGSLTVSGFLNFSQAVNDELRDETDAQNFNAMDDEWYGGLTVAYEW